jgi:ATP adenylyltransferase
MSSNLWAPWRMQYILAPKDKSRCVFCEAVEAPEGALRERRVLVVCEHAAVLLNTYPFNASHLLVIPRAHVSDLEELSPEQHTALWDLTRQSLSRLRAAVQPQGVNLGMNLGPVAGAGIADHAHVHLVPRWLGDTNFMPVVAEVHVMPQHLDETWCQLYPYFTDLAGRRAPPP